MSSPCAFVSAVFASTVPIPDFAFERGALRALTQLWAPLLSPDMLASPFLSFTVKPEIRNQIDQVFGQLNRDEKRLLCCVQWQYNTDPNADLTWELYQLAFGNTPDTAELFQEVLYAMNPAASYLAELDQLACINRLLGEWQRIVVSYKNWF